MLKVSTDDQSATLRARIRNAQRLERLVNYFEDSRYAHTAMLEVVACGQDAVSPLRRLLLAPAYRGIPESRCWAARALARLGARDVLLKFLSLDHKIADVREQMSENAVINEVSRALAGNRSEDAYRALRAVAENYLIPGVLEALGEFQREEDIPLLVRALGDHSTLVAAEYALGRFGTSAMPALRKAAANPTPSPDQETSASARLRRNALRLALRLSPTKLTWLHIQELIDDRDEWVAVIACATALDLGSEDQKAAAVERMIDRLGSRDRYLRAEIQSCLFAHFQLTRDTIQQSVAALSKESELDGYAIRRGRALRQLAARVQYGPKPHF